MISEIRKERTETGTREYHLTFFDENLNPVDESVAAYWRVHVIDERGIPVNSYMGFPRKKMDL